MTDRRLTIDEPAAIPPMSLALGYGAMAPLPVAAVGALMGSELAQSLAILWAASLLLFLSGVRRGLSFRTEGGPRASQIAVMLWLFVAGVASLVAAPAPALAIEILGFASLIALDPVAAARGEAPPFFARLRPPQLAIPVVSLGVILATALFA